jgi:hypothetical protein
MPGPPTRSLVVEDRSAKRHPQPDGTETPVRAGSAAGGQTMDNGGMNGDRTFAETAGGAAYSVLTSGGETGEVESESPHLWLPQACGRHCYRGR